jgi:oxalate decarboxylase/phosphoglucose isomerase-like protein (cupin superfamily)
VTLEKFNYRNAQATASYSLDTRAKRVTITTLEDRRRKNPEFKESVAKEDH